MREVNYTNQFQKDLKREGKSPNNKDLALKLQSIVELLCSDQTIPVRYRDHYLVGEYSNTRELHVKPDLLLIYIKKGETTLTLIRLGSHAEIFG